MDLTSEIALNLWYVRDEVGVIYSLRVRPYVCAGSEDEILAFLQERAKLDYLVAQPFPVPQGFHMRVIENGQEKILPVAHVSMLDLRNPFPMFNEGIQKIEAGFPSQTNLTIPENVLVCVTALQEGPNGEIEPSISRELRF